jgi:PAS domain S-box-containing protein
MKKTDATFNSDTLAEDDSCRMLDRLAAAFYAIDTQGVTTSCNVAFLETMGFEGKTDVVGRNIHDLIHHSRSDGSPFAIHDCPIYQAARSGDFIHAEHDYFFAPDGRAVPVEYWVYPLKENGRPIGAIVIFNEITEKASSR